MFNCLKHSNVVIKGPVFRAFSNSYRIQSDFSHLVIGGGVVGTAISAELQRVDGNSVLLVEQNEHLGMETTSRNSEVIHAGLYYPKDSLKGKLCIRGKNMIYEAWEKGNFQVPLQKCGKWIVAQNDSESEYLENLYTHANDVGVPVNLIPLNDSRRNLPLIQANATILESPTTGIISAHDLTYFFQSKFENEGGTIGFKTKVVDIEYNKNDSNYTLLLVEKDSQTNFEITTDNLINSAGLYAQEVSNLLLPEARHYKSYFAKGTYFSYQPENPISTSNITDKLIYPCPNPNASSLGTHLTFDLGGQLRFGPDLEWLDVTKADDIDYAVSELNLKPAYEAVKAYFPQIHLNDLQPSYTGVRPKIFSQSESKQKFADFIIKEEDGFPGFVNLLGIESPGLTASWAIAEHVKYIYHK